MKFLISKKLNFLIFVVIITTICFTISLIIFNQGVFAQVNTGLDTTADAAGLKSSQSIAEIAGQIIYVILGFLAVIFIILLIYGGFVRMTAQGNPEAIKKSNGIITSAVIGIIIIVASYTITAFVLSRIGASVGEDSGSGINQQNSCSYLGGGCHLLGSCPSGTADMGQRDCGYDTAGNEKTCCVPF